MVCDPMRDMKSDDWIVVTFDGTATPEMCDTVGNCTNKVCFSSEQAAIDYAENAAIKNPCSAFGVYKKRATFKYVVSRFDR